MLSEPCARDMRTVDAAMPLEANYVRPGTSEPQCSCKRVEGSSNTLENPSTLGKT